MATGKDILNKAISHIGETGGPTWAAFNTGGTNWGTGWAWCCAFVWRVFKECGASALFYGGGKTASVGVEDNWLYSHCKWVKYDDMQPGDVVIFTWYPTGAGNSRSGREKSHTGIIERRVSSTEFYAIEGNTGSPAQVRRRLRNRKYVYAIYRPNYASTPTPTPTGKTYTGTLPSGSPVLKYGSRGTAVKQWQAFINWYFGKQKPLACDGIYGANTKKWTLEFQRNYKSLVNDGIVGPATIKTAKAARK